MEVEYNSSTIIVPSVSNALAVSLIITLVLNIFQHNTRFYVSAVSLFELDVRRMCKHTNALLFPINVHKRFRARHVRTSRFGYLTINTQAYFSRSVRGYYYSANGHYTYEYNTCILPTADNAMSVARAVSILFQLFMLCRNNAAARNACIVRRVVTCVYETTQINEYE